MVRNEALLRTVIENPDEDTPRLVYADCFEENGEPERAEFIRVQCELDKIPAKHRRRAKLQECEKELLGLHGWAWAEELAFCVRKWVYRRGFVERVEMLLALDQDNYNPAGQEIRAVLELAPIRHLRDWSGPQYFDAASLIKALPSLDRLTGLELWGLDSFRDEQIGEFLASPHLANLRTLILHHHCDGQPVRDDVIVEALHSPYRSHLEELAVNVGDRGIGPSRNILKAIASSPYLRNLRRLNLTCAGNPDHIRHEMDAETIRVLGKSPNLRRLKELDLGLTCFPTEAWDEVLKWPFLPRLKWLGLNCATLVDPPRRSKSAEIHDHPAYRGAFEQKVAEIEWEAAPPLFLLRESRLEGDVVGRTDEGAPLLNGAVSRARGLRRTGSSLPPRLRQIRWRSRRGHRRDPVRPLPEEVANGPPTGDGFEPRISRGDFDLPPRSCRRRLGG